MIITIFFDFDGVILDSFSVAFLILKSLNEKYELTPLTEDKLMKLFEGNIWENYEKSGIGKNKKEFQREFKVLYDERQIELKFFVGMRECIIKLAKKANLVIISSNYTQTIKNMLKAEKLNNCFQKVLGADVPGNKRTKIISFLRNKNISPSNTFFVSDTTGDIKEIEGLDIHTIAVSWGYHSKEQLELAHPDDIVYTPEELERYFNKV
jgi:phosphoglycolate phosphatase